MDLEAFRKSVEREAAPAGVGAALEALWWDAKGDWERAHELAQEVGDHDGDWVHAYLHRKEGDEGNARYWYARSGKPFFEGTLDEEWSDLVGRLLA